MAFRKLEEGRMSHIVVMEKPEHAGLASGVKIIFL